jgi:hypothetical protein
MRTSIVTGMVWLLAGCGGAEERPPAGTNLEAGVAPAATYTGPSAAACFRSQPSSAAVGDCTSNATETIRTSCLEQVGAGDAGAPRTLALGQGALVHCRDVDGQPRRPADATCIELAHADGATDFACSIVLCNAEVASDCKSAAVCTSEEEAARFTACKVDGVNVCCDDE